MKKLTCQEILIVSGGSDVQCYCKNSEGQTIAHLDVFQWEHVCYQYCCKQNAAYSWVLIRESDNVPPYGVDHKCSDGNPNPKTSSSSEHSGKCCIIA